MSVQAQHNPQWKLSVHCIMTVVAHAWDKKEGKASPVHYIHSFVAEMQSGILAIYQRGERKRDREGTCMTE